LLCRHSWLGGVHSVKSAGRCSCSKPECKQQGKHPRTEHGFKDASKDPEQIRAWWKRWPDAPIGVATGEVSNFVVVDVDLGKGGPDSLIELEEKNGALQATPASHRRQDLTSFALPGAYLGTATVDHKGSTFAERVRGAIAAEQARHAWQQGAGGGLPRPMPLWLFERARVARSWCS
jgi:hypothetical protein